MVTTELDVAGRECVSFTVSGPWAHFRRIDSTTEKLTYRVMPRTTIAGFIAAVLGLERNSYYDIFDQRSSAIAISPQCSLETQSIPQLTLPTKEGNIKGAEGLKGKSVIDPKEIANERQRRTFEYIVDASYRFDVALSDDEIFERLCDFLETGKATYTPCLGKTECLASISEVSRSVIKDGGDSDAISSIVAEDYVVPEPGTPLRMERTPAFMTTDESGRKTTGFVSYGYAPDKETLSAPAAPVKTVDDRSICFL